ncbi:unnamed protein product [Closterium sp. Naga37s-1]|nr:unnamed protein product [Closterium sp. Naga37s-1]
MHLAPFVTRPVRSAPHVACIAACSQQHAQPREGSAHTTAAASARAIACTRAAAAATHAAAFAASAAATTASHCSPYLRPAPPRAALCPAAQTRSPTYATAHEQTHASAAVRAPAAAYALGAAHSSSNCTCLRYALLPVLLDRPTRSPRH